MAPEPNTKTVLLDEAVLAVVRPSRRMEAYAVRPLVGGRVLALVETGEQDTLAAHLAQGGDVVAKAPQRAVVVLAELGKHASRELGVALAFLLDAEEECFGRVRLEEGLRLVDLGAKRGVLWANAVEGWGVSVSPASVGREVDEKKPKATSSVGFEPELTLQLAVVDLDADVEEADAVVELLRNIDRLALGNEH
jgi:hypothetical protein